MNSKDKIVHMLAMAGGALCLAGDSWQFVGMFAMGQAVLWTLEEGFALVASRRAEVNVKITRDGQSMPPMWDLTPNAKTIIDV